MTLTWSFSIPKPISTSVQVPGTKMLITIPVRDLLAKVFHKKFFHAVLSPLIKVHTLARQGMGVF